MVMAPPRIRAPLVAVVGIAAVSQGGPASPPHAPTIPKPIQPAGCLHALEILAKFHHRILSLPQAVGDAHDDHPLAQFSGSPAGCVPKGGDAWEVFNGSLDTVLQKSPEELRSLVKIGEKGLIGLHRLLHYLVVNHGIVGGLIESKIERLMKAMDEVYVLAC